MSTKTSLSVAMASLIAATAAWAESAHKGYRAIPDQWPSIARGEKGFRPEYRGSTYSPLPFREFRFQAPRVRVDKPDPPTNAAFKAEYWFKMNCTVTVQKVYMLLPNEDGTITNREIKTTPLSVYNKEVIEGYYAASFTTEEVSFKEGDVFLVVFKINGEQTMAFLRILYVPFEPS